MLWREQSGWWTLPFVMIVAATPVLFAGVALAAVTVFNRSAAASSSIVAVTCAFGLLAATPVQTGWDDGCNDHFSTIALAGVPYVRLIKPASPYVPYVDGQTSVACLGATRPPDRARHA